jgi:sulfur carrier protein ThiS
MVIKFSRHAKRRAKLYNIPEATIEEILKDLDFQDGEHEIIKDVQGFEYPIKVVVSVEGDMLTVITSYPLKKGRRQ